MAVGRISGPLLKSNLLRDGVDLAFENDLLYLDVSDSDPANHKIGIKTTTPQHALDVNGTINSTNLIVDNTATFGDITVSSDTISSNSQYLNLGTFDNVVYQNKLRVDSIDIENNVISTNVTNENLELNPNGTGVVQVNSDMNVTGNIHAVGNITADGSIQLGDDIATDTVSFAAEIASDMIPDETLTYQLGSPTKSWNDLWVGNIVAQSINSTEFVLQGVDLTIRPGNLFYVSQNGDDTSTGSHPQDPFATITQALDSAQSGDTIHIFPGEYEEQFPLVVDEGITVKGENIRGVTIKPTLATNTNDAFLLNGQTTIEDLTVKDFYSPGYAFRYAPGATVTSRSPYIRNISVITKGSSANPLDLSDPRGFNDGDAGKGVLVDGAAVSSASKEAGMLFHSVTFITPGVDALTATNGARIEWLNSFTYFANRGLYAYDSSAGLANAGKTRVKLSGVTGTFAAGDTVTFTSTDASTVATLTVDSVVGDTILVNGKDTQLLGFDTTPASIAAVPSGATATKIENLDLNDFGAEVRMIGSANVYGNYGLYGDGAGVIVYAIGQNLAYIGNGKEVSNDPTTVIQANEVVELNDAKVRYNSVDHKGDFRVGDLFYVNQETGSASFNVDEFNIDTTNGVNITTGGDTTYIDGTRIDTGNLRISGNTISSLTGDINFDAATDQLNLLTDVSISGNLDVTGNITLGGNLQIGDETTDTVEIVAGIDSDLIPNITSTYNLGSVAQTWKNLYIDESYIDDVLITDNFITTTQSNTDLELRANGTGVVSVPSNNTVVSNTFSVLGTSTLNDTVITGTVTQTGNTDITGDLSVTGNITATQNLNVTGDAQFEEILINDNFITTTSTDVNLELRANGAGVVVVPTNNVTITNDLVVNGFTQLQNTDVTGTITSDSLKTSNVEIRDNFINAFPNGTDLVLSATGTGVVYFPSNDVVINNNLTMSGGTSNLRDTVITGTVTQTGNSTINGQLDVTGNVSITNTLDVSGAAQFEEILIDDNFITTTTSDTNLELRANGIGQINLINNTVINNDLNVTGTVTAPSITVENTITADSFSTGDILIDNNVITTTLSNSDLELVAAGTGEVIVPVNNVILGQDLTVSGTASFADVNITGSLVHVGDVNISGNASYTGTLSVDKDVTVNGQAQLENILINDNFITTTQSNSDLELRANGTGEIIIPANDVIVSNDLTVLGTASFNNITSTGTITADSFSTGDILIDNNVITTTLSNSDLELVAAGTGEVIVPVNNVILGQDLTVSGTVNLGPTAITGNVNITGDVTQTGSASYTGTLSVDQDVTVNGQAQLENILINDNVITTTQSNSDLELRANGTGEVIIPTNDVRITQDLTILGTASFNTLSATGTIVADSFSTGDILIDNNVITTTQSNSDLELVAAGTGEVTFPVNDVNFGQNLNVAGSSVFSDISIQGNLTQTGGTTQIGGYDLTGNMSVTGTLTVDSVAQFEDIRISGNIIETTQSNSNLTINADGSGVVSIPNNDLEVQGDLTVGGVLTLSQLTVNNSILSPEFDTGDITIANNIIRTNLSNSDLELRANGTGVVYVPTSDVTIDQNLTVGGTTTLSDVDVVGNITQTGNTTQTGNINLNGNMTVSGIVSVNGDAQFEDIQIADNVIETTTSNSDLELRANGTGNIVIPDNNVVISNDLTIIGDLFASDLTNLGVVSANSYSTGDILIDDNFITTTVSNSDLELRANGTGSIVIDNLDFNDTTISSSSNITLSPATGYVTITGTGALKLPTGNTAQRPSGADQNTGQIRYNSELSRFEGFNGANWITLQGVEDVDGDTRITPELNEGDNDDTIRFYTGGNLTADLDNNRFRIDNLDLPDIEINNNTITTKTSNTDLTIVGNGTGNVVVENFRIGGGTITNTVTDSVTTFNSTGNGYFKIPGSGGFVIPVGDNVSKPTGANTEAGMIRYNTQDGRVEIYNGTTWTSVAGSGSGISIIDAENIAIEYVIVLG